MAAIELTQEIVNFLKKINKNYDSRNEKEIAVVEGFIPDMSHVRDLEKFCPRIIVRAYQIEDSDKDLSGGVAEIKVLMTFLTYAETDEDAYLLIYNWVEKNRRALLKHRHLGAYVLMLPMTTRVLDEDSQPRPMWGAYIEATYQTVSIEEEGLIEDDYGYE